jgi:hypothetical protein
MFGKRLIRKAVAGSAAAACAFVAVLAFGATVFFGLALVMPDLAAAAVTMFLFAAFAAIIAAVFLSSSEEEEEIEEVPEVLAARAYQLFRQRPILGTVAGLAGGWIFLRNPALATMVAAAFTEKSHARRRR